MRVLVVDDDMEMAVPVIKRALECAGHEVIAVTRGSEALKVLRKGAYRLVISDWKMPEMTGPELCRAIRSAKYPGYVYVILLTAYDGPQQKIDGLSAGADDFIAKPFNSNELVARVASGERILLADRAELQAEISTRRLVENELIEHRQDLERANADLARSNTKLASLYQTAQRFVDNVSHEFRTPLTVIKGYAEAVAGEMAGPVNQRQKEFLGFVVDRTRDLAQMVDDLLDSSKLRAGTLRIDRESHPVETILAPIRPMLGSKAACSQVTLIEEIAPGLPEVFADMEKAGRVIVNLVVNAVKFSPENGQVTLWAHPGPDGGVEIGVTDRGPGISPENLELIFDRFKQLGDAQNEITKGFGLGLNIARELAALNLGEVRVTSSPGQGSTFSFTLPPSDPEVILRRYLAYLQMLPNLESTIGLLRITHTSGEGVDEGLRKFIASTIRPTDLILQTGDGQSLLVAGCTGSVTRWIDRLKRVSEAFSSRFESPHGVGAIAIEPVGEWAYRLETEQFWSTVLHQLKTELTYA